MRRGVAAAVVSLVLLAPEAPADEEVDALHIGPPARAQASVGSGADAHAAHAATSRRHLVDFERFLPGPLSTGFSTARTGTGLAGAWEVREDPNAPSGSKVLRQTSADPTSYRFPVCVYDPLTLTDGEISVRFKPLSGEVDQAGGIVWRYRDEDNYYVVRANALEDNVVLYKMEHGKRSDLKPVGAGWFTYGEKADVPSGKWSELHVVARGSRFEVSLNGAALFVVDDDTFAGSGKVGLWTKADSVTSFDDLTVQILDAR